MLWAIKEIEIGASEALSYFLAALLSLSLSHFKSNSGHKARKKTHKVLDLNPYVCQTGAGEKPRKR
jgi:uncharacterized protein YggU (UPF0235/DUF167 family)